MFRGRNRPQQHCKGKHVSQTLYPRTRAGARTTHPKWYPVDFGDRLCDKPNTHMLPTNAEGRAGGFTGRRGTKRALTSYSGMDRTASTTARDIKCWTNGILCPRCDLRGTETSRVKRAHPTGLSQAFGPLPGR